MSLWSTIQIYPCRLAGSAAIPAQSAQLLSANMARYLRTKEASAWMEVQGLVCGNTATMARSATTVDQDQIVRIGPLLARTAATS
mmetsp:Transcript_24935/g.40743  ORF Transcript_24935/g.40743 Transcript_24935/m.40743 type:complete len:85 (-) Transcript_24935:262-516(-)